MLFANFIEEKYQTKMPLQCILACPYVYIEARITVTVLDDLVLIGCTIRKTV